MTTETGIDLTEEKLFSLGWGLIYKCVCAPKGWSADRVSEEATKNDPPGTSANRWVVTSEESIATLDDSPFKAGNPQPCNDDENRRHWLVNC